MKRNFKKLVSLLLVFAMSLVISAPAFAKTTEKSSRGEYTEAIEKLNGRVIRAEDGTLYLKTDAKASGVDQEYHDTYVNGLEGTNSLIKNGYLATDERGNINVTQKYVNEANKDLNNSKQHVYANRNELIYSNSTGVTKIVFTSYGFILYLNNVDTKTLVSTQRITAPIFSSFPIPAAGVAATVLSEFTSSYIEGQNSGTGVEITCIWVYSGLSIVTFLPISVEPQAVPV